MGQEVATSIYSPIDHTEFNRRLKQETQLLSTWFDENTFEQNNAMCGFELEACIVDKNFLPSPCNHELLQAIDNANVVPELAKYNIEFNSTPLALTDTMLRKMHHELAQVWHQCRNHARAMNKELLTIGILPTIKHETINLDYMSALQRYFALNQQVMALREYRPININIDGVESLHITRHDIMLEAAATSLQIHLQINPDNAKRFYNAAHIISAPMIALTGNSPYLFHRDLWYETRIPMFEQALASNHYCNYRQDLINRVSFGTGYANSSLLEPFMENVISYPTLLPITSNETPHWLNHVRLHNGTIWRWNRPLIGLSPQGKPHLRLEHRVIAAGPTIPDVIANIAFYIGIIYDFAEREKAPEKQLSFEQARHNFYNVAKYGMQAELAWFGEKHVSAKELLLDSLLPLAKNSLKKLGFNRDDIRYYLDGIIKQRLQSGKTGSDWQRAYTAKHGRDFQELTHAYAEKQNRQIPICQWAI